MGNIDNKYEVGRLKSLQAFQVFLLRHALLNFPTVKGVVYSTCSINREENEDVIDEILTNVGDAYELVSIEKLLKKDWINYSSNDSGCKKKCIYAKPKIDLCNGFFVALFKRNFDVPLPAYIPRTYDTFKGAERESFNEIEKMDIRENNDDNRYRSSSSKKKKKKKRKKRKRADGAAEKLEEECIDVEEINDKNDVINSQESSKGNDESTAEVIPTKKLKKHE